MRTGKTENREKVDTVKCEREKTGNGKNGNRKSGG